MQVLTTFFQENKTFKFLFSQFKKGIIDSIQIILISKSSSIKTILDGLLLPRVLPRIGVQKEENEASFFL